MEGKRVIGSVERAVDDGGIQARGAYADNLVLGVVQDRKLKGANLTLRRGPLANLLK